MDVRIYPFLIPKQGPCWTLLGPRTRHVRVQSQDFYPTEPSPGRAFKDTPRSRIETVQEYPAQGVEFRAGSSPVHGCPQPIGNPEIPRPFWLVRLSNWTKLCLVSGGFVSYHEDRNDIVGWRG
jgi:hypothetical protein